MRNTLVIGLLAVLGASGCETNPVTGKDELMLISESQELSIGQQQYAPMRQSEGGEYVADPGVAAYVSEIGQRLAAVSDRKLPYEFTVINNSVPNAWALPGGKIAVNRGLLTELNSEAELAAVLGHEIVHAAAKHGAQGMQRGLLLQGAVIAATIATQEKEYANLAQLGASLGAQLINQKYGRDAERESDQYGMSYMSRAGYDPQGAVDLQKTFVRLSEGRDQDWLSGLFASHPPSPERVQNNIETAAKLPTAGDSGREPYQRTMARLIKTKPAYGAYRQAQKELAAGDTGRAQALVQKAIAIEPREGHFYSLLGDIDQRRKRFDTARGHYNEAIRLNPDFFYYYLQRGLVNAQLNADTAADSDLKRSMELLPTANAVNALGDIARAQRRYVDAKKLYAQAADHDSAAGKAAFASLVELDLADNPGAYIKVRTGLNRSGRLIAEISNTTTHAITGVVLALRYPDSAGRVRQAEIPIRGQLDAGHKEVLDLNLSLDANQARQVRSAIVAARIAR